MIEPYYQDNMVTIYHGDCLDILPKLGRYDLLLTDPPYGLSKIMVGGNGHGWGKFSLEYSERGEWDDALPEKELLLAIESCDKAIVWGGQYYILPPSRCWLIWQKPERGFSMADAEMAWTTIDGPIRTWDGGRHFREERVHPTQKPAGLMEWCIGKAGDVDSILDPFMGSGTTLVAARRNAIPSVGIEIEEKYCEIAVQRVRQRSLFETQ